MFELAYDLPVRVDSEVVFVNRDDRHRKVRILVTACQDDGQQLSFTGHSLGSSVQGIKAAKREETPVVVQGQFQRHGEQLIGEVSMV